MSKTIEDLDAYSKWAGCPPVLEQALALLRNPSRACPGIPRPGCQYLSACGSVCNKCGQVHSALLLTSGKSEWSPVFALAPNGYLWFALDCGHVVRGVKSGEHFNWSDDAENGDHECCDSAIAVAWMAIAIPDHPSANKCKRKTGPNGEPCGLMPPCPDCGLSCHDVAEGG